MTVDENDTYYIFLFELNVGKINAAIAKWKLYIWSSLREPGNKWIKY